MKSLKGTQTEKNILTAFAGESQARNRYDFFAAKAKSDGYVLVRDIFQETALQEKEHAKRLFKFLEGGDVEIVGAFPAGIIGATEANLLASAAGENHEHTEMYPSFAAVAEKEGFSEIEFSAMQEIGNIITGAYLNSLSMMTNLTIIPTPPSLTLDMAGAILSVPAIEFGTLGDKILLIQSQFYDEVEIDGYFILVPDIESYPKILTSLGIPIA